MKEKKLSIVHFSTSDREGGSAKSAYKIHSGLKSRNYTSRMLVGSKTSLEKDIDTVYEKGIGRIKDRLAEEVTKRLGLQYFYYPSSKRLLSHQWIKEADIIQLYNTHGGYFSHRILPRLSKIAPVVWRLSDMWPVTGHCAYSGDCRLWLDGCLACPQLESYPPLSRDSAALLWKWKKKIYKKTNLHIVAPSSWAMDFAKKSPLFKDFPKIFIPNGVDLKVFRPLSQQWCRDFLNIPKDKKAILFIAHSLNDNPRKGGEFLIKLMNRLTEGKKNDFILMIVGIGAEEYGDGVKCDIWRHGFTGEEELLSIIYNSSDLLIHPAVVENFPNTIIEGMACGRPSVAFNTGGVSDAVRHMKTGYLAEYKNEDDLLRGTRLLLEDETLRSSLGDCCRKIAENEYSLDLQARRFIDLYTSIVRPIR